MEAVMSPDEMEWIAEAIADLYQELTAKNQRYIKLTIIGDPEEYEEVKSIFERWSVDDLLTFVPETDPVNRAEAMKKGSILLVPNDQKINKLIKESLKHHLPVMTINTESNRDYLDHTCSMLLEPAEPRQLVHKLAETLEILFYDPEVPKFLRRGAEIQYIKHFTWQKETV